MDIQREYAANLSMSLGSTALYKPIPRDEHSGLIGDVEFFDADGNYTWLQTPSLPRYTEVIVNNNNISGITTVALADIHAVRNSCR